MYSPKHFEEDRINVMHDLMDAYPFSTLITMNEGMPEANHIPVILIKGSELGVLQGHLARSNPVWKNHNSDDEVLVIFQGPQHYITPSWYASKTDDGKVVPTWNYISVHARGKIRFIQDKEWLLDHVTRLTSINEKKVNSSWTVSDAPQDYISKLVMAVVGFEITLTALQGKWKLGQNRSSDDKKLMISELEARNQNALASFIKTHLVES